MNKKIVILCLLGILLVSPLLAGSSFKETTLPQRNTLHRGSFEAELGIKSEDTLLILEGTFKDFRKGHLLTGTVNTDDSERSTRFQGISSRNLFLIQASVKNNIVTVFGRFTSYDEDIDEYSGQWRGFVIGYGRTSGWITAQFTI